jgi:NAD(P)-dependent dehydrogenase (short-subunit alcohol dehydrogenase family)
VPTYGEIYATIVEKPVDAGHPDEVAAMVAYLARPEAAVVTAASLTIDGGLVA